MIVNLLYVGVLRLERRTTWSQTRCASQLRHTPDSRNGIAKIRSFFEFANISKEFLSIFGHNLQLEK